MFNQKGTIPLLLLIAIVGIISFLAFSSLAPFKDKLISSLYPKPSAEASGTPAATFSKKTLIFSFDQGWINGITQTQDQLGLDRMIAAIKPFQSKYQVFALYSPINKDPAKVKLLLDELKSQNIPFIFDAMSSDARKAALGNLDFNKVADQVHGLTLTTNQLQNYKNNYGDNFAGVRVMEPFVVDRGIKNCKSAQSTGQALPSWCSEFITYMNENPGEAFFKKSNVENILNFAKNNQMFTIISDSEFPDPDSKDVLEKQFSTDLFYLLDHFPAMVVLNYETLHTDLSDNNPGNTLHGWNARQKKYIQNNQNFFGLSDQQYCKLPNKTIAENSIDCPMDPVIKWATMAFDQGAVLIQFEPSWWVAQFPSGVISSLYPGPINPFDYTQDLPSQFGLPPSRVLNSRGFARNQLVYLAKGLGVDLTQTPGLPTPGPTVTPQPTATAIPSITPSPFPSPSGTPYSGRSDTPKVTKVSSVAVCVGSKQGVKITWTNPANMLGYHRIFRIQDGTSQWLAVGWTNGSLTPTPSDYTDYFVYQGTHYAYAVESYVRGYAVPSNLAVQENPTWPLVTSCN